MEIAISGYGVLSHLGEGPGVLPVLLGEPPVPAEEVLDDGLSAPVGRIGLIRNHPFGRRYERFGQMDTFSRYAFIAAGHALDAAAIGAPDPGFEDGGVIYGTAYGCQDANAQFDQFSLDPVVGLRGASPLAFKGTVDNAPAGWSAVGYTLRGVNATFVSGIGAGAEALLCARSAIVAGRARRVVAGAVERLIPLQLAALYRDGDTPEPFAAEGAVMLVVEDAAAAAERGHVPAGRLRAADRLPGCDAGTLQDWITRSGYAREELALVSLAPWPGPRRGELATLVEEAGISRPPRIDGESAGSMMAGELPLALAMTIERLRSTGISGPALVLGAGEGREVFAFIVET
ncbi:MAG: beta-ketoacyl synthase N-terminal-like domain-containing protein [Myxococcota bacterium]|nr:beta-ketoacyl synthase N-terminal-like domain-containing protein [Myxococcota bacterium]